ncbi:putative AMP-binding enzyme C-terminal domain [Lyophyllum shimeji]|uniref:AMP-binding enzyme C-terminal domain n=1 Tax=Lyophyllum shimeji TaxID=47721 RepID=A0A9P3PH40_LYOSH|nr:putative AMP-binding enzyme C-terminal domain [Lyophyllum shimeji]
MTEFRSISGPLPHIPDDLTIPQFIFNSEHATRPQRPSSIPWLIEDYSGRRIHQDELHQRTRALANALHSKWNIATGDTVCIFSPNNVAYPVCIWAVHSLGGIITPANPGYKADELVHQLRTTRAALLIVHPAFFSTAQAAARDVGLSEDRIVFIETPLGPATSSCSTVEELVEYGARIPVTHTELCLRPGEAKTTLAFLSFSSGTTGKPKAVAIPHYAVIANVIQMTTHYRLNDPKQKDKRMVPGDVAIAVLPFFHIYGLVVNLHFLLFAGLSIVVIPKFNFPAFLDSVVRHRITHLLVVPPQVVLLCKHPSVKNFDFSQVKFCMSGAAPLSGELVETLRSILPNAVIGQGYGLTETCTSIAMLPPTQRIATVGSAGQLIPGIVARVVKQDGSLASEGEQGELVVTGPSMALRYQNNEAATKETFVKGWVHTGDEVIIKDHNIYVVDRLKEIMKVRGFQVAPAELEGHLFMHPDVADACVVSVPDDYSGELPLAFIVLTDAAMRRIAGNAQAAAQLKVVLAKHVADAKVPYKHLAGGVEFIDAIPKNPSGKMLRRVLRDQARKLRASSGESMAKL